MTEPAEQSKQDFVCPSCERSFDTEHGMKVHHVGAHDESLAKVDCECETCGERFREFQSRIERGKGRFCSQKCKHSAGGVTVVCYRCGEQTERHRVERYDNQYCSRECYFAMREERGENAVGWIDGRFGNPEYFRNYNKRFRENRKKALQRDNETCQSCGLSNQEHVKGYDHGLYVHHIQPLASFGVSGDGHDLQNLVSLCIQCHRDWEGVPLNPEVAHA